MRWKTDYCFVAEDLYQDFDCKQMNISDSIVQKKYKVHDRQKLCGRILVYFFYLVIKDIIENNITFVCKFKAREMMIHVKSVTGELFKRLYRKGLFMGIDYISSNFTGYQIWLQYDYKGGIREKPIYINSKLKETFYENINNGKQYY